MIALEVVPGMTTTLHGAVQVPGGIGVPPPPPGGGGVPPPPGGTDVPPGLPGLGVVPPGGGVPPPPGFGVPPPPPGGGGGGAVGAGLPPPPPESHLSTPPAITQFPPPFCAWIPEVVAKTNGKANKIASAQDKNCLGVGRVKRMRIDNNCIVPSWFGQGGKLIHIPHLPLLAVGVVTDIEDDHYIICFDAFLSKFQCRGVIVVIHHATADLADLGG